MKAVNLIPSDARRNRGAAGGSPSFSPDSLGPGHFIVGLLVVIVALIVLRVLADNTVNDRKATLAAVQAQVTTEQAQATQLQPFITFVEAAEARQQAIEAIANARFPWKTKLVDLAHVLPKSTSLTTMNGSITGAATSGASTTASAAGTPTFALTGCADTRNQNGTATLLRRLNLLPGVTAVNFSSSTRTKGCGNAFNVSVNFTALAGVTTTTTSTATPAPAGTATTATTTTATTAAGATTAAATGTTTP